MFSLFSKLVKVITLKKVLLWSLAMFLGLIALVSFEHRAELFQQTLGTVRAGNVVGTVFSISAETKAQVKEYVKADKQIIGFEIVSADIRLNSRNTIYSYREGDTEPEKKADLSVFGRLPLFTNNGENNRQIVRSINGEFYCLPAASLVPAEVVAMKPALAICRASLPPYYGQFSGYVTAFLLTDPTLDDQIRLKAQLEQIANEVYFRDVVPTVHKVKL